MTPVSAADLQKYWDGDTDTLIDSAIEFLQGETHRYFGEPKEFVEILEGSGTVHLWLKEPPDTDQTVKVEERFVSDDEWEEVDEDDYEVDGRKLVRVDGGAWNRLRDARGRVFHHIKQYRVTYTFGYDDLPADVEEAVALLVKWRQEQMEQGVMMQSESLGDYSYTLLGPLARQNENPWVAKVNSVINRWRDDA